ncbi:MAG: hypothetical protein QM768_21110 [Agriterribacter sp.]
MYKAKLLIGFITLLLVTHPGLYAQQLKIAVFEVNATPPVGSPVAYAKARSITDSLSARGIVFITDSLPIVFCVVDWIGISNEGHDVWRKQLAAAAGTTVNRVSVHALHQHDGPRCDYTIERIMMEYGLEGQSIDNRFTNDVIIRAGGALRKAMNTAVPVTHIGVGQAKVDSVASNRRVNKDGNIVTRYSKATDSFLVNAPEGLIDPWLKCVSFWNGKKPVTALTFYTTHPQSYYGQGDVTCEFVGIARNDAEKKLGIPLIHFNGASGNIAAGKYNDGSVQSRIVLTNRVEAGMLKAWENTTLTKLKPGDISWRTVGVALPLNDNIKENSLRHMLTNDSLNIHMKLRAAEKLAWYQRNTSGLLVDVAALRLGKVWMLSLPGESFVEYQLAAQQLEPGSIVCTAAYADYGPGYIGTKKSYSEKGGYETSDIVSGTGPDVEEVLMKAMEAVLR